MYRSRAAEVGKQRLRGYGKLCAGNLMCSRFVTSMCYQLLDNDELCLRTSGIAQMFQYSETILVLPVVKDFAQKEDGTLPLLHRLRVKEVVTLGIRRELAAEGR